MIIVNIIYRGFMVNKDNQLTMEERVKRLADVSLIPYSGLFLRGLIFTNDQSEFLQVTPNLYSMYRIVGYFSRVLIFANGVEFTKIKENNLR